MNILVLCIGIAELVFAIPMLIRNKFYKYDIRDSLFETKFRVFGALVVMATMGLIIVINELSKLFK